MLYSQKVIVARIKSHIKKRGGARSAWVVGMSKEPRACLFKKHGVRKAGDFWILMHAKTHAVAQEAWLDLSKTLCSSKGPDLKDPEADFVYAYRKSANTKP